MLGQSEYGLYSLVSSIISYLTIFDLGFGNAIIIYTTRYKANGDKEKEQKLHGMFFIIYTIIGLVAGIVGTILYFNTDIIFGNTMTDAEIQTAQKLMFILLINLILTFPLSIFSSIITAYEKFVFAKVLNILRIILTPLIMIPLLLTGHKSLTLVIVITILNISTLLTNMYFCLKKLKIKLKFGKIDFKLLKEIFSYSFYIFLNTIIDKINWNVDQFILGAVSGTVAVAVYSVAAQINNMYLHFSTAISGVLLPKVTQMEARHASNEEFTKLFIKTGRMQFIILALIVTGFVLFGQQFIMWWAGPGYEQSYIICCILMIPILVPLIQNVGLSILQAKNLYKNRTRMFIFIAIGNIIISIFLAKLYGGIGAALGTAISQIIGQIIILNIYYHKKVKLNMISFWKQIFKMSIPVFISFIIGIIFRSIWTTESMVVFGTQIIIYVIIYGSFMWLLGLTQEEKMKLMTPLKKIKELKNKNVRN